MTGTVKRDWAAISSDPESRTLGVSAVGTDPLTPVPEMETDMAISNDPRHLLFIHPTGRDPGGPVVDSLARRLAHAMINAYHTDHTRGEHYSQETKMSSDNCTWVLTLADGVTVATHLAAVGYLVHCRSQVRPHDLAILERLPDDEADIPSWLIEPGSDYSYPERDYMGPDLPPLPY